MGKIKVSAMPTATALTGGEIAMVIQGGQNKKTTLSQIVNIASGALYSAQISLSSAQILALHTTPVLIVSAPGADRYLSPVQVDYVYTFVTTAYTRVNSASMFITYNGVTDSGIDIIGSVLTQANNALAKANNGTGSFNGVNQSFVVDKGLFVKVSSGGSFTLGDGTLKVKILYHIVDI